MALFIFLLIYFILVFVVRSWWLYKNTGINPLTFSDSDDAHGYNGKVFKIISVLELIVLGINAFAPKWVEYLMPFWYLENKMFILSGWILLVLSLIWVSIAQTQMSSSWRIGIDHENKSELVTSGLFNISRNPIFLGIMIANLGLFLVLPNAFTLLIISLSTVSMNTQIRIEEEFLRDSFGDEYHSYARKVRRWI